VDDGAAGLPQKQNFVIAEVTLSRDVRPDRFETVWRELVERLASPAGTGEREGLWGLLDRWYESVGVSEAEFDRALAGLTRSPDLDPSFRAAIVGYLRTRRSGEDPTDYLHWFRGEGVRPPGVRVRIDRSNARAMLRSLVALLGQLGYGGLALFLDELELLGYQHPAIRDGSYEALRQLIDDVDGIRGLLMLCSITPRMFTDDQKGLRSYPALWQRLGGLLDDRVGVKDYRSKVIRLDLLGPPDRGELLELARRIRRLHGLAFGWPAERRLPDRLLETITAEVLDRSEVSVPRLLVQSVVSLLDALEQDPDLDAHRLASGVVPEAAARIQEAERSRYRTWSP
jgi:hypothetical protein